MNYDLLLPQRVAFGWGRRTDVGSLAKSLGRRAFIVCGSRTLERSGQLVEIEKSLAESGIESVRLATISREPEVTDVDATTALILEHRPDQHSVVIGIGGGSAIDLAKAVAAMATNRHGDSVADFLEGVGRGLKIENAPLPMVAMPTTAGTGSEATKNSVISSYAPLFKKSLRSDQMVPRMILIDPELSVSVPRETTAHTGMDAITQLIEACLTRRAIPVTDALCFEGLRMSLAGNVGETAIVQAVEQPTSRTAREQMAQAALLSGVALANAGLGMAHGVAAALGVHCRVAHGLACAVMLPAALRVNRELCADKLERMATTCLDARNLPTDSAGRIDAFLEHIDAVAARIGIPRRLSEIGVTNAQISEIVKGSRGNSMSGNPHELTDNELQGILEAML